MAYYAHQVEQSLDVLRLSPGEIEAINRELDRQAAQFSGSNRRQDERHPYRRASKMVVTAFHPGGTTTRYLIEPRNISRTGLAFLHGGFLHIGTQLVLSMHTLAHQRVNVLGQIVHCKFVRGNAHEVGVRFNQPIDLSHFLLHRKEGGEPDLPRLVGRVLCVEHNGDDLRLLRFILDRLGVQAAACATLDDAADKLAGGMNFDVILADVDGGAGPQDTHARVRAADREAVLVAMTADDSPARRHALVGKLCHGLMTKPLDAQAVALVLLQHLPLAPDAAKPDNADPDDQTLYSALWQDESIRPLILDYLEHLREQMQELLQCLDGKPDLDQLARAFLQIKGSAGSYGYPQISDAAMKLRQLTEAGESGESLRRQVDALASLCRAACRARGEAAA